MFDGTTLIVDVETLGENSYALSLPAEDLWVAYEVVRRHVDANGVRHYSQMTEAKTTSDGYSFKFDTGDTFTCASHLGKPTSSTLSDTSSELPAVGANDKNKFLHTNESTGALEWAEGGSGGDLVVHIREDEEENLVTDVTFADALAAHQRGTLIVIDYFEMRVFAAYHAAMGPDPEHFEAVVTYFAGGVMSVGDMTWFANAIGIEWYDVTTTPQT